MIKVACRKIKISDLFYAAPNHDQSNLIDLSYISNAYLAIGYVEIFAIISLLSIFKDKFFFFSSLTKE